MAPTKRPQWRFFWPHAQDDMNGARWRDVPPSPEEIEEWREDIPACWLEQRWIYEGTPIRVAFDSPEVFASLTERGQ